jgi:hypothetical protein
MPRQTRSNIGVELLRWNLDAASREFGFAAQTIRAALNKNSATPAEDNCFSTQQICDALYGALHLEKIRTQREMTEKLRIENMVSRAELLNRQELAESFSQVADAIKSRIMSCSEMPLTVRQDILTELSSIPVVIADVARKQSRFRDGKNRPVESADEDSL